MTMHDAKTDVYADTAQTLPWCDYPSAAEMARHGLQELPSVWPLIDHERARPYRSRRYRPIEAAALTPAQLLDMAKVVGDAFARCEPMIRHLQPPLCPPAGLQALEHVDPFGRAEFGDWTRERLFYWLIRLVFLTDPASSLASIHVNREVVAQSLAILDESGRVIGGAFNETMPPLNAAPAFRRDDPFLNAILPVFDPVLGLLGAQDAASLTAMRERYPEFRRAHDDGKVGHHVLVARSDALPRDDTFELVAATVELYERQGFAYMVIGSVSQWTGAACEALGGIAVHFAPFRAGKMVPQSHAPLEGVVTSPDGFLSDKDSGSMLYVIRFR